MLKFMKYEIRGTNRFIMMLILAILVASTGLQLYGLAATKVNIDKFPVFLPIALGLVIFGAFVTSIFYIVSSFRKELYEDRGYLTFSLPISGKQIVGTKLFVAIMWSFVIGLSMIIFNIALGSLLFGTKWVEELKGIMTYVPYKAVFIIGIAIIISYIQTMLLIYFSMTLSKVSINNKKIGGLWFILFLLLSGVLSYITMKMSSLIPYYLDLNSFKIITNTASVLENSGLPTLEVFSGGSMTGMLVVSGNQIIINIASYIFSIVAAVATFFGTTYLIDKKVEI